LKIDGRLVVVLLHALLCALSLVDVSQADDTLLSRIAFGACAKQDKPQPIWDAIIEAKPQRFLFIGDNIYGDSADMEVLKAKYALLGKQPGYQRLKQICPVLATWDDHDYGLNDGGGDFVRKRESQQVFLDFFEASPTDVRRTREGVYSAYLSGPAGKRVQIILLDSRYFRSPLKLGYQIGEPGEGFRGKYAPDEDPKSTMLGEAQWNWLEKQLQVPAEVRIMASSVQVLSNEHGWESWGNFPRERERLLTLIRTTKAQGVILISGDRHLAEISCLAADAKLGVGYPLYDITSTSLNAPSGNITKAGTRFANEINSHRVGLTYFDTNFGMIRIDWDESDPVIRLQICDEKGGVVLQQRMKLSELKPR